MKLAVAAHGRFVAFDHVRTLLRRGHDVVLLTNYPGWAVARFGIDAARVRSFPLHGILARIGSRLHNTWARDAYPEAAIHRLFGKWAAARISRQSWDAVVCWSGIAEETLRRVGRAEALRLVVRGSAHIRAQARILEEEERRTGVRLQRPSRWMIAREEREYALADRVIVLSTFAAGTFLAEGVPGEKVRIVPPGIDCGRFRPSPEVIEARCARIAGGAPLRVLNVGTFSRQKGMTYMAEVIERLAPGRFEFRFVGAVAREAAGLRRRLRHRARFEPHRPESRLPDVYAWGDVFVLPTLQDGFAVVLQQAATSGLPVLTTRNGAGLDLIREGLTGWVLPAGDAGAFVERLRWCDGHRAELASMVRQASVASIPGDGPEVASALEEALASDRLRPPSVDAGARQPAAAGPHRGPGRVEHGHVGVAADRSGRGVVDATGRERS